MRAPVARFALLSVLVPVLCEAAPGFELPLRGGWTDGLPFDEPNSDFGGRHHLAVDLFVPGGTPVYAVADGRVVLTRTDAGGYKGVIVIEHTLPGGAKVLSLYGHLSTREGLKVRNGPVERGALIASVAYDDEDAPCLNPSANSRTASR